MFLCLFNVWEETKDIRFLEEESLFLGDRAKEEIRLTLEKEFVFSNIDSVTRFEIEDFR